MEKAALRTAIRARRAERSATDLAIAGVRLAACAPLIEGAVVAAFVGVRGEPPTLTLLDVLRARGIRLLLPVTMDDHDLDWAEYRGPEHLVERRRGIREPDGPLLGRDAIAAATTVLVPALAVDQQGWRLGQGGGSYDRVLPRTTAPKMAIVFDEELVERLPNEAHDRRVAFVLTPIGGLKPLVGEQKPAQ